MGTRSNIGILNANGTVQAVYCHWDGYPENNGKILLTAYRTEEKVRELLALGSLSSLGERIIPIGPHTLREPEEGVCVSHAREGGEQGTEARTYQTVFEAITVMEEFLYILTPEGWIYSDHGKPLKPLTPEACGMKEGGAEIKARLAMAEQNRLEPATVEEAEEAEERWRALGCGKES